MAEKEKSKKSESKKSAKKKLKGLTHHIAEDGGYVHEHHYHDGTSAFGGYSPTLEDVHQHIDDHLSPEGLAGGGAQEPEGDEGAGGGGGAPPAPGGGGPPMPGAA